ncbi:MAG: TIGR03435 family protein, partial [Vicinamibacterales bacterium]
LTTPELALRGATIARQAQDAYLEVATDLRHDLAARPTLALVESDTAMRRLLDARLLPSTVGPLIMVPVDRSDEETAALLRHELTHAFVTSILGPLDVPLWITEGVAAHQSGVWGALERSRLLRLLGGRALPTLASLNAGTGDREVASTVGHAAFDFIDARWGKQGIRDLLLALRTAGGDVGASTDAAFGMPLADFDRAFADYAGAILSPPPPPAPPPAAATVRQADPAAGAEPRFDFTASRITVRDASLSDLIRFAYGLRPDQLVGGPAWLDSERFDVTTDGDGDGMHYGSAALRAVLEDRFALRLREGTIDVPVYELRAAGPLGPSLSRSPAACHGLDLEQPYQGGCGLRWQGIGRAEGHGITMAQLAATISHAGPFDRPVVDRTGLSDAYDFELRFTPYARRAESPVNRVAQALEWASITDPLPVALREQLGLSLVEGTGTAPVFIVDHVAHPERD